MFLITYILMSIIKKKSVSNFFLYNNVFDFSLNQPLGSFSLKVAISVVQPQKKSCSIIFFCLITQIFKGQHLERSIKKYFLGKSYERIVALLLWCIRPGFF